MKNSITQLIEIHRQTRQAFENTCRQTEGVMSGDKPKNSLEHRWLRLNRAEERTLENVCAFHPRNITDAQIKADYLTRFIQARELTEGQLLALLFSAVDAEQTKDPLLELVRSYEAAIAASNALPDEVEDPRDWMPHYKRLVYGPPAATTLEGALAALRLLHREEVTCGMPAFTAPILSAVLAYFDGGGS